MKPHVRIFNEVKRDLFSDVIAEVGTIDWDHLPIMDRRAKSPVFNSSSSLHIRVHEFVEGLPRTRIALSATTECQYTSARNLYPSLDKLSNWIYKEVSGIHLGRIMLVKLLPSGSVPSHVDDGLYFEKHYRFHVPIITNNGVVFTGPPGSTPIHMPAGYLCQLDNIGFHGVENNSDSYRIHLIIDIESNDERFSL